MNNNQYPKEIYYSQDKHVERLLVVEKVKKYLEKNKELSDEDLRHKIVFDIGAGRNRSFKTLQ